MKKILFITPYFGRSGSEMQLLYILERLDTAKIKPHLFTRDNGVLLNVLPKHIHFTVGYKKHANYLYRLFRILLYAVNINPIEFQLRLLQKKVQADYWYINSISNRDAYEIARKLGVKVISHVHELPFVYGLFKPQTIENMLNSKLCIACSEVVAEKIQDMGHQNVQVLNGFVDAEKINISIEKEVLREKLNLKTDDFIWVISGNTTTIKGVDFIIPLIKQLKSNHKIVWIGEIERSGTMTYVMSAIKHQYADRIFFLGKKDIDYYNYLNLGDAFLSISREDSFPLVMIEAAHLGMPIVGFNSGGISEFVNEQIGIIVAGQDYIALSQAMRNVEANYNNYNKSQIKAYAQSYHPDTQVKKLIAIIDKYA
jgi:glycosyltransferase involved in cell wall biosynthesis